MSLDLTNHRVGRLTAVRPVGKRGSYILWECLCDCGNVAHVTSGNLRKHTQSCGCRRRSDLTGQRFGRLTVLRFAASDAPHSRFICQCDCGNIATVAANSLVTSRTRSCGCLNKECSSERIRAINTTHGHRHTPEYGCWTNMKTRCTNPDASGYERYGGRGISVCPEWMNSFEQFHSDMGDKPEPKQLYSIERLNNDGNYSALNCVWATKSDQAYNRRNPSELAAQGGAR
jgi:hypothetical protein